MMPFRGQLGGMLRMPDSSDGEPPGNIIWLGRDMHVWIARELTGWWEDLLDQEVPENLLQILDAPRRRHGLN